MDSIGFGLFSQEWLPCLDLQFFGKLLRFELGLCGGKRSTVLFLAERTFGEPFQSNDQAFVRFGLDDTRPCIAFAPLYDIDRRLSALAIAWTSLFQARKSWIRGTEIRDLEVSFHEFSQRW